MGDALISINFFLFLFFLNAPTVFDFELSAAPAYFPANVIHDGPTRYLDKKYVLQNSKLVEYLSIAYREL